jgi:CheY-like chemotaxis protein
MVSEEKPLKVLIADDTDTDRLILTSIVKKQGHIVVTASDGLEAVEGFIAERPDIVLLDALMPHMDGFEAARQIKAIAGEEFVPIIFLTSLKDADSLAQCLEAGGDDFMSKPYNRIILQAKIKAFRRMREMQQTMRVQRDQIAIHNEHLITEQEVAKQVFDNVTHSGCVDAANLKHLLSPLAVFNGDVLLAAMRPSGSMLVFLGDFTGHGLPAAIGAMPLASTFYGMAQKGYSMSDILREVNQKLKMTLPVGVFCCGCMIDVNFIKKTMSVWLGGLPDCYLFKHDVKQIEVIQSDHLPLGVLSSQKFSDKYATYDLKDGDRFYMWSDGIHEALNSAGEMFGSERLIKIFEDNKDPETLFDEIGWTVNNFIGEGKRDDDISVVEVKMVPPEEISEEVIAVANSGGHGPKDWAMDFEIRSDTFRDYNPLPMLLNVLMEVPGLRPHSGSVYTILAELYSNALEHGVMGLDSRLKQDPRGFAEYYAQRTRLMEENFEGRICFHFDHIGDDERGELLIRVEDSGRGFEYSNALGNTHSTAGYCGRGIPLIRDMCSRFEYMGAGNIVEAVYNWSHH